MGSMQVVTLPHLPTNPLYLGVFRDVRNVAFLRHQLLSGNADFEYAFIDASVVLSTQHLLAACFRAINDLNARRLKTRNVHAEIVFSLSPNNNIAEAFRRFGLGDDTKHVITIRVGLATSLNTTEQSVRQHMIANVEGALLAFSDATLSETRDVARIRKLYKIQDPRLARSQTKKHERQTNTVICRDDEAEKDANDAKELEGVILGLMALQGS